MWRMALYISHLHVCCWCSSCFFPFFSVSGELICESVKSIIVELRFPVGHSERERNDAYLLMANRMAMIEFEWYFRIVINANDTWPFTKQLTVINLWFKRWFIAMTHALKLIKMRWNLLFGKGFTPCVPMCRETQLSQEKYPILSSRDPKPSINSFKLNDVLFNE